MLSSVLENSHLCLSPPFFLFHDAQIQYKTQWLKFNNKKLVKRYPRFSCTPSCSSFIYFVDTPLFSFSKSEQRWAFCSKLCRVCFFKSSSWPLERCVLWLILFLFSFQQNYIQALRWIWSGDRQRNRLFWKRCWHEWRWQHWIWVFRWRRGKLMFVG